MQQIRLQAWDVDNSKWVNVACDASGRMLTTFPKGRKPTDVLGGSNMTEDEIFDWLKGYIPNNGDQIVVNGGWVSGEGINIVSYAKRVNLTVIALYRSWINTVNQSKGNGSMSINDGGSGVIDEISMSV